MRTEFEREELVDDDGSLSGDLGGVNLRELHAKHMPKTPIPVRRDAPEEEIKFDLWGRLLRNLLLATAIAIVPGALAIGASISLWIGSGLPSLHAARLELVSAEDDYHRALEGSQPLLAELNALGAPREQLEAVYFAFADAPDADQRRLADQYLGVLIDQMNIVGTTPGELPMRARGLLMPSIEARGRTIEAYQDWQGLRASVKGQIISLLWLTPPPSPGMEVYENATVRKLLPPVDPSRL